jgi:hypothetical protein
MFFLRKVLLSTDIQVLLSTDIQLDTSDTGCYKVMLQVTGMPHSICTKVTRNPSHYTPSVTSVSTASVSTITRHLF